MVIYSTFLIITFENNKKSVWDSPFIKYKTGKKETKI